MAPAMASPWTPARPRLVASVKPATPWPVAGPAAAMPRTPPPGAPIPASPNPGRPGTPPRNCPPTSPTATIEAESRWLAPAVTRRFSTNRQEGAFSAQGFSAPPGRNCWLDERLVNRSIVPVPHGIPCWAAWSVSSSQTVGTVEEFWLGKDVVTPTRRGSPFISYLHTEGMGRRPGAASAGVRQVLRRRPGESDRVIRFRLGHRGLLNAAGPGKQRAKDAVTGTSPRLMRPDLRSAPSFVGPDRLAAVVVRRRAMRPDAARLVGEPARDGLCTGGSRRAAHRRGGELGPAWRRQGFG